MAHALERPRHRRSLPASQRSLVLGGLLALLLSAWAGLAPTVGSSSGFSPDGTASWTWNLVHALGTRGPGALGLLAFLGIVPRPYGERHGGRCGAWPARRRRALDVALRRLVRLGPRRLAGARRRLLPRRLALVDPRLLDGPGDRTGRRARRLRRVHDGAGAIRWRRALRTDGLTG